MDSPRIAPIFASMGRVLRGLVDAPALWVGLVLVWEGLELGIVGALIFVGDGAEVLGGDSVIVEELCVVVLKVV